MAIIQETMQHFCEADQWGSMKPTKHKHKSPEDATLLETGHLHEGDQWSTM